VIGAFLIIAAVAGANPGVAPANGYTPDEATTIFRIANEAFAREDMPTAIEGYERLLAGGFANEDVEYNLGTAYLKAGKLGPAILHLERALRASPFDSDARANLERAQRLRVDKLVGVPEESGGDEPFISRVVSRTNVETVTLAFVIFYFGCALALFLRWLVSSPSMRTLLGGLAVATALGALPTGGVVAAHAYEREMAREAIVMAASAPVKEGPGSDARTSFEVHEGLKVRILGEDGNFVRIRLANGLEGWTEVSAVTPI
jgi:tetratricopeptide (TPR) repeat protein